MLLIIEDEEVWVNERASEPGAALIVICLP
jgi:hypothetical protein